MLHEGQNDGTSTPLTVSSAAAVFEGLLSAEEDAQPAETPQEPAPPADEADETETPQPDESDATEQADESEEPETQDEPDEQQPPAPRTFTVKVDGQDVEVTEDELLKGYSRTADYTRKTQQLAEERKKAEADLVAVRDERKRYADSLAQLDQALKAQTPAEPDWDALRADDPQRFAEVWAVWQQHKQRVAAVEAETRRAQERVASDQMEQLKALLTAEREKLVEAVPAWKDADVQKREKAELMDYARAQGYTDAELGQVYDHRVLVLLRKAMLHDKAEKAKPIVQARIEKVKAATPGSAASVKRPPVTELTRSKQRLAKTGRVADAAAVIETMLD